MVVPGDAVAPVVPLVGPKRIVADGVEHAVVVVIPRDNQGNVVAAGTSVQWRLRLADGTTTTATTVVGGLLAWLGIGSHTTAGRTTVAAVVGTADGPTADLFEIPGRPQDGYAITLVTEPTITASDGAKAVQVAELRDAFGNLLVDGTEVTLEVADPDGSVRTLGGVLNAGAVQIWVRPPAQAGISVAHAVVAGSRSAPLSIVWPSPGAGRLVPVTATLDASIGVVTIGVGPVRADLGAYPPDGTPAWVVATCGTSWSTQTTIGLYAGVGQTRLAVPAGMGSCVATVATAAGSGAASFNVP